MADETPNVRIRVHDEDCEHCDELRESSREPFKGFGHPDDKLTHPSQLHSLSGDLARAYERATGEPLDLEVRLFYQGHAYSYAMSEADARALFQFHIGANSKFDRNYKPDA
ncbi:hypothetical protein GR925_19250 [Streptomyces sp. HUCO-GS316]|uniref:hypothetical protein n=1 Tax=Streptomyces sp. HUCO-GS316 TaxID=2692198 RepID=UPI00136CB362|nr:hypothetical protein [Streptomyces sp. HUCO-GS316]MXM65531.1 hypothetical protein [Streptomyces sp. HUCO-GS316]